MSRDDRRRDAISQAARDLRRASGNRLTQTQAEARVRKAVTTGDAKRANNNR